MKAENVHIRGYGNLDQILRHYENIIILINYIKEQPDAWKVFNKWDVAREKPIKEIEIIIK